MCTNMGGKRTVIRIKSRLPNHKSAIISQRKIGNYLLNPTKSNGKSTFFNGLGYNMKNAERFESDIRKGLENNKAVGYDKDKYGNRKIQVDMMLGINKKEIVVTAWQIDKGKKKQRLITVYPKKRKE